jgi:hypothetical protein
MITRLSSILVPMDLRPRTFFSALMAAILVSTLSIHSVRAQLQTDNFNDGNDAGWTHYDPFVTIGVHLATWSFPAGGYRIQTTGPSPDPGTLGPGRAGSLRSEIYTNFYLSIDFVNWNDSLEQAAGLLARIQTPGLGTTTGYAFTWSRGNPTNTTGGDVDISVITAENPDGISVMGSDRLHLVPGNSYRFVFIGRGPSLEGRVYLLPETNTPIVSVTGTDSTYEYGTGGLVIYDDSDMGVCDVTFDSYLATDVEAPTITIVDLGFSEYALAWPVEAASYTLQSSGALGGMWTDISPSDLSMVGDQIYYYLPTPLAGAPTTFYRLIRR